MFSKYRRATSRGGCIHCCPREEFFHDDEVEEPKEALDDEEAESLDEATGEDLGSK